MNREDAERLGREAAETDLKEGLIDDRGCVVDEDYLKDHIRSVIRGYLEGTDFGVEQLRDILDAVDGQQNDFIGRSALLYERAPDRFPEKFSPESGPPVAVKSDDVAAPVFVAGQAYEKFVMQRRKAAGFEGDWSHTEPPRKARTTTVQSEPGFAFEVSQDVMNALSFERFETFDPNLPFEGACPSCNAATLNIAAKRVERVEKLRGKWITVAQFTEGSRRQKGVRYRMVVTCVCGMTAGTTPETFVSPYKK